jgi:serine/threonine protein kinase
MQACAGLHAAHELKDENGNELGLVHRDISPQNILVSYDGVAKVADFGIAKAMARGESTTHVTEVKGKLAYLSPEQASRQDVDRRSDVFALGILLYQLATGRHPFRGMTDAETIANIMLSEPEGDYPRPIERVLKQCLAKDPAERYPSASALRKALQSALPPQQRVLGYEEIAEFLDGLLGEAHRERSQRLTTLLNDAAEKTSTGLANGDRTEVDAKPPGRKRLLVGGIAALGVVIAASLFLTMRGHAEEKRSDGHPRPPTTTTVATVKAAAPQVATTSQTVINAGVPTLRPEPQPSADTTAVRPRNASNPRRARSTRTTSNTAPRSQSAGAQSSAGTHRETALSPVRTPGF